MKPILRIICWFILLPVLALVMATSASAQQKEPQPLLPANSYAVRSVVFYKQQLIDAFPAEDYPEAYTSRAKQVIEQFCLLKQQEWLGLYLRAEPPAMPDSLRRTICEDFIYSSDEHEPMSYLLACWMLAPSSKDPLHGGVDPLLVREVVDQLILEDYPPFVQCLGYALLRHALILDNQFGRSVPLAKVKQQRVEEALRAHQFVVMASFLTIQEGQGDDVDEELLVQEVLRLLLWDYKWDRDLMAAFNEMFQQAALDLDPEVAEYRWAAQVLKAQYHRDSYLLMQDRQVQLDAERRYHGKTVHEHREAGNAHLEQAWADHPDRPYSCMQGYYLNLNDRDAMSKWLTRGMDPQLPTVHSIYRIYRESVSPRWTGSTQGSLAYIFDIIDTPRNGLILAEQVMWATNDLREDTRSLDFVKAPGYYEHMVDFCRKMIEADYDSKPDAYWYELWAAVALLSDHKDEARRVFEAHGDGFGNGPSYLFFNVSWDDLRRQLEQ